MPQVLPKMWATHPVGVIGNNSYLIWKSETPNSVSEDLRPYGLQVCIPCNGNPKTEDPFDPNFGGR